MTPWRLGDGVPEPLGATWDGAGVNFALATPRAERVSLCLFDEAGQREVERLSLPGWSGGVWHGYLPGGGPGLFYGYRIDGRFAPEEGLWFNPHKLLLDPHARALGGHYRWHAAHRAQCQGDLDTRDNAPWMLKGRVHDDRFDWADTARPETPWSETVIYELNVKGFTARHPAVPELQRGRFAGIAHPAVLEHLTTLGVTAVELLPVQAFLSEPMLAERGLTNYWGYNSLGFFAPDPRYGGPDDFKAMVRALHGAGIEVLLDVVYNHTAEGDEHGPLYAFRGIDNDGYYRLVPGRPGHYVNDSGCGNTMDLSKPRALALVLDSLRYWAGEMGVDGFRFDLAPVLGRGAKGFDREGAFFQAIQADPLLSRVKLIAEPWDLGLDGYQLGRFPRDWSEWNGPFRDQVRDFWLHRATRPGEMAHRLTASSDLFHHDGRSPRASINFVTSHDGFTLADLVAYQDKHNEANLQGNRDGHDDNRSWNAGVEGPSDDPKVLELRGRLRRALLASLVLSQGVPMVQAGDELGRSQGGNNNAYCQDNEISWLDWEDADQELFNFARKTIALRRAYPQVGSARWFDDDGSHVSWLRPDGGAMTPGDWDGHNGLCFGFLLKGATPEDEMLLVLLNPEDKARAFTLPEARWRKVLDSTLAPGDGPVVGTCRLEPRSLVALSAVLPTEEPAR
jgi:glycogen debranching enzyme GlgX